MKAREAMQHFTQISDRQSSSRRCRAWYSTLWICTLLAAAVLGVAAPREAAAQATWIGNAGGDGLWGTGTNWSSGVAPSGSYASTLVFSTVPSPTPVLSSTNNISNLNLTSGTAIRFDASGFTLSGSAITLSSTIANLAATGTNTINFGIQLGGSRVITGTAGSTLELTGNISNTLSGTGGIVFQRTSASGSNATFVLSGSNSYTGGTRNGSVGGSNYGVTLIIANSNAIGSGTLSLGRAGTFSATTPMTLANNLNIDSAGGQNTFVNATNALEFTGTTFSTSGNLSVTGSLTLGTLATSGNAAALVRSGVGTLIIRNAAVGFTNGFTQSVGLTILENAGALGTGTLTLSSGTLRVDATGTMSQGAISQNGGTLSLATGVDVTYAGLLAGANLTKTGAGKLILAGTSSATGVFTVADGTVVLSSTNSVNALTLNGANARLELNNANAVGGTFTLSQGTIVNTEAVTTLAGNRPIGIGSSGTVSFAGPYDLDLGNGAVTPSANDVNFNIAENTLRLGGNISTPGTNKLFTKLGAGTLRLSGTNSFGNNSNFDVRGGVLRFDTPASLPGGSGTSGNVSGIRVYDGAIGLGFTSGTLTRALVTANSGINLSVSTGTSGFAGYGSSTQYVNISGTSQVLQYGVTNFFFGSGTSRFGFGAADATQAVEFQNPLNLNNTEQTIVAIKGQVDLVGILSGVLSNGSLRKTGLGALALTANNTFGGVLTVAEGAVEVATINNAIAAGPLGNSANAVVLGSSGNLGTLSYTGGSASSSKAFTAATGGTAGFNVTTAGITLTLSGAIGGSGDILFSGPGSVVLSGGLSGAGNLFKTGTGALTLAGPGHSGDVTVTAGRLNINANNALGDSSGVLALASGVSLDNTSGDAVAINSAQPVTLGSSLTFLGSDNLSLGSGTVSLSSTTTIDVVQKTLTFGGDVVGGGFDLIKTGTGVLELAGLSGGATYSGNTDIQQGELSLTGTSTFSPGTIVTIGNAATLRVGASASVSGIDVRVGTGTLITSSPVEGDITYEATRTLTANDNFTGRQTIGAGIVLSMAADYLGTITGSTTPERIVIEPGATFRSTSSVKIPATKGILIESGSVTFESLGGGPFEILSSVSGSATLVKTGSSGFRLFGTNSYTGGTVIRQGTLGINSDASLGAVAGRVLLDGGTLVAGQDTTFVELDAARSVLVAAGKTGGMDATTSGTLRFTGGIHEENPAGAIANMRFGNASRAGTVILGGTSTYRGITTVTAGRLTLLDGASLATSSRFDVASNATFDVTALRDGLAIASGQTLGGYGTVAGNVTIGGGAILSPGGSIGTLTNTGTQTWAPGGSYLFEVTNANGSNSFAGTNWDLLDVGSLLITASSEPESQFMIMIQSLTAGTDTTAGSLLAGNWDPDAAYQWKFVSASNPIALFDSNWFTVNTDNFLNSTTSPFTVVRGDDSRVTGGTASELYIVYGIAVPEPGTIALAGIGIAMAGWSLWKRQRIARITGRQ
jgi:fibronectin-binding autotransporter adhesin